MQNNPLLTQRNNHQLIRVIQAARAVRDLQQEDELWLYIAITDDVTCSACLEHDGQVFRRNNELDLTDIFPEMTQESATVIRPNVHMALWGKPTCRCKLFLSNLAMLEEHQPDKPVMNEQPQLEKPLTKQVTPTKPTPTNNPFLLELEQTQLSESQYSTALEGLLYFGYISLEVYNAVINRRKKQKEQISGE
jgi:hypothetical protein